jgi:hypothetical protein
MEYRRRSWVWGVCLTLTLLFNGMTMTQAKAEPKIQGNPDEEIAAKTDHHGLQRLTEQNKRVRLFGYGEIHYNDPIGSSGDEIDFHRFVIGVGFDFTDKISFEAELDFEHAFTEPELEFAHVDFELTDWATLRAGSILVPMGVLNEQHEPPLFNGVERPQFYTVIIPTSWMEGGIGFHGDLDYGFNYQVYLMSMPKAATLNSDGTFNKGFSGSSGVRGGRFKVGEAPGRDFGGALRVQNTYFPGLRLGASGFFGNTSHGQAGINGAFLAMVSADAKFSFEGIDLEGIVGLNSLGSSASINTVLNGAGNTNFVGSKMLGYYLEGGYHIFHHLMPDTKHDVILFGRYEDLDTQYKMPVGFAKTQSNDRRLVTAGVTYKPIPQIAFKANYTWNWNDLNAGVDQFDVGMGFYY